jgi:hypothetical protein
MAYALSGLQQLGPGGKAPRIWVYSTTDTIATVNTAAYFDDASDLLQVRDIIFVCDTNAPTTTIVSVLTNASGVVDVSDGTTIAETDSD